MIAGIILTLLIEYTIGFIIFGAYAWIESDYKKIYDAPKKWQYTWWGRLVVTLVNAFIWPYVALRLMKESL